MKIRDSSRRLLRFSKSLLWIAFEESHRCEFGLLDVQIPGLRKLEQRTQIISAGGVNDDDALALFELGDDVVAVHRREQQHRDGEEEPEPRQPVTLASSVWIVEHVSRTAFESFQKKLKSF